MWRQLYLQSAKDCVPLWVWRDPGLVGDVGLGGPLEDALCHDPLVLPGGDVPGVQGRRGQAGWGLGVRGWRGTEGASPPKGPPPPPGRHDGGGAVALGGLLDGPPARPLHPRLVQDAGTRRLPDPAGLLQRKLTA